MSFEQCFLSIRWEWIVGYWGVWFFAGLLIVASALVYLKGHVETGLRMTLLAWQFLGFDTARSVPDLLCDGTVLSHSGPAAAVSGMLAWLAWYWMLAAGLTLPIAAVAWTTCFRWAIRRYAWETLSTGAAVFSVVVAVGGISWALCRSPWP